jgi:peptidoglycan/LPS O-acetylase OafA/YrhL
MQVLIPDPERSTWIVIAALFACLLASIRRATAREPLPAEVSQQLKGFAILAIVFAHVSFLLVNDFHFLYPLARAAGVGVDLFLLMSGYGLTASMLKRPVNVGSFYRRRLVRIFIPLWIVLALLFLADGLTLGRFYPAAYVVQSVLGIFPSALPEEDVNSPFWYLSWLLMFYLLFPIVFSAKRPWLTALALAAIANVVAIANPLDWQANWLHRLHTNAFPLGILLAWLLQGRAAGWRSGAVPAPWARNALLVILAVAAGYLAAHNEEWQWPRLAGVLENSGLSAHFVIGQAASLTAMTAVVVWFMLAPVEIRLLTLFGEYSYETYLLHWPLMARYDFVFRFLPAWAAILVWLAAFIAFGWLLQRSTALLAPRLDAA